MSLGPPLLSVSPTHKNVPHSTAGVIAAHIDEFVNVLHESVRWGGFAVFGGPDENGEARMHM